MANTGSWPKLAGGLNRQLAQTGSWAIGLSQQLAQTGSWPKAAIGQAGSWPKPAVAQNRQ